MKKLYPLVLASCLWAAFPVQIHAAPACDDPCCRGEDSVSTAAKTVEIAQKNRMRKAQDDSNVAIDAAHDCMERIRQALTLVIRGFSLADFDALMNMMMNKACQAVVDEAKQIAGGAQAGVDAAYRSVGPIPSVMGYPVASGTSTTVGGTGTTTTTPSTTGGDTTPGAFCKLFGAGC